MILLCFFICYFLFVITGYEYGFEGAVYGDEYYDNEDIVFSINGINEGDIIKPKEEKEITITFKYKDGKISENNTLNSYLNFKFTKDYVIPIASIVFETSEKTLYIGENFQLNITKTPQNATEKIQWSSSDDSIATVSETGLVIAQNIGEAIIRVEGTNNSNISAECKITVKEKQIQADIPYNVTYNGNEQKWIPNVTDDTGKILVENTDYVINYDTANFIEAGNIRVIITGKGIYTGTITRSYTIERATLKITTSSASKTFDGSALTSSGIIIEGIINNEVTGYTTGSRTAVGASANTYVLEFKTGKEKNYNVIENLGTLTVNEATAPTPDYNEELGLIEIKVISVGSTITVNDKDTIGYRVGDMIELETVINSEKYGDLTNVSVRQGSKNNLVGSIVLEPYENENIKIDYDSYSYTILKISGEKCNLGSSYVVCVGDGGKNGSKIKYYVTITASKEDGTSIYAYTETKEILIELEPDDGP